MKLLKTTLFSALITFIRISSGFVTGKAVAIFTGPAGVAIIGAFSNFISIVLAFANGAITNGIVKYTAEYNDDNQQTSTLFSTALRISVICSIFVAVLLLSTANYLSTWIFKSNDYSNPLRVLGLTIILYSLNSLLIAILNGKSQIKLFTLVNTIGSIAGLLFTVTLVFFYKIQGALYAIVLSQSIVFFITLILVIRSEWFSWSYFKSGFNVVMATKLSHYSLMSIITALTVPVTQIFLRNLLIEKVGIDSAGFWQGMMRISDGYLMLLTTSLATYYLPKLSSLKTDLELRKEVLKGYRLIIPTVFIGCTIIYFLRFFIIKVLYTNNFLAMENLFLWQLIGDFFKMSAWILSYLMLAKAMTKAYIITEIIFSFLYILLGYVFIIMFGLQGVTIAFAIAYIVYFLTMIWLFRKILSRKLNNTKEHERI